MNTTLERTEADGEGFLSQLRDIELLSAEREREVDARKWAAVADLKKSLLTHACGRELIQRLAEACRLYPPSIDEYESRDQYFLLRRELEDFFPGAKAADAMEALERALCRRRRREWREAFDAVDMTGSLVVALAVLLVRSEGNARQDAVADAIVTWQRSWPGHDAIAPEEDVLRELRVAIGRYIAARDVLTRHNLRLVLSIAGKHRNQGISYMDLVQEGTLGLLRAAEKFEAHKGFRFSTYGYNWINQAIRRHIGDVGGLIRYPAQIQDQVNRIYRLRMAAAERGEGEPSECDLAKHSGIEVGKIRSLLQLRNIGVSIDDPLYEDGDTSLQDTLPGGPFEGTAHSAEVASLHDFLLDEIESLEPAERRVIVRRWGLHDGPPLSRAEVADSLSVSREWVRQLELSALAKLRNSDGLVEAYRDYASSHA